MIKVGKFLLTVLVFMVVYIITNALMPFSPTFKMAAAESSAGTSDLFFLLVFAVWVCFVTYFIITNTHYTGKKLFVNVLFIMFFVLSFMTQIETLLFNNAFPVLTKPDVMLIMTALLIPLLAVLPLQIQFFQKRQTAIEETKLPVKGTVMKLGIIGIIYMCVYMIFGHFVVWHFEALRVFYAGSPEEMSFWAQMAHNVKTNPLIFLMQIVRGMLFGIFVLPLTKMIPQDKKTFIEAVCLVYISIAVPIILPNAAMPDIVRFAHLMELSGSMTLFGVITANILWNRGENH